MENDIETAQIFLRTKSEGRFHDIQTIMGSFSELMVEYAKKFEIELPNEEEIEKTAKKYAIKHSNAPDKDTPDWIMADFKAGVKFILNLYKMEKRKYKGLRKCHCSTNSL